MALYRLSEDAGALRKPSQYVDMTQALVVGGFAIEGQRDHGEGHRGRPVRGRGADARAAHARHGQARAPTSSARRCAGADKALAAAKTGDAAYEVGKLYFSAGDYAKAAAALRRRR